jgi:hypothetical protein
MKCEFEYCIYNNERHCVLDEIEVDSLGMCRSCEIVAVPDEILRELKEKRLRQIANETA